MNQEIFEKVKNVIVENLGIEEEIVVPEAKLIEQIGVDSLDLVEIAMSLEDEFEIEINDADISELKTVGDLVKYIEKNQK